MKGRIRRMSMYCGSCHTLRGLLRHKMRCTPLRHNCPSAGKLERIGPLGGRGSIILGLICLWGLISEKVLNLWLANPQKRPPPLWILWFWWQSYRHRTRASKGGVQNEPVYGEGLDLPPEYYKSAFIIGVPTRKSLHQSAHRKGKIRWSRLQQHSLGISSPAAGI